ncbi:MULTISPECIES: hypothetical protein [unclassified Streptomyces]|uniref:hypothetical protein n=1 Tax=unclassified Streptomyces TaxID=2593676 RepID=UPI002E147177|nr:hypothetical protein OG466_40285 [Streptomyces sp. NBC_01240]
MSNLEYAIGLVLALVALAAVVATPFLLAHSRTAYDHGPGCWWCHPRLLPRKRR